MGWFSGILTTAKAVKAAKAQQSEVFVFDRLGPPNGVSDPCRPVETDEEYISIMVKTSRISDIRRWTGKFHAAVHARSHYLHEERGEVEVPTVLVPALMKDLDPGNLDRVVSVNQRVLGPVPYVGELSLELGLFSVKGEDLASPYIDLLTSVAQASGTGFLAQGTSFVAPLQKGLDLLFGNRDRAELEIGIEITWPRAETGSWVLMRAPQASTSIADLRLHPQNFSLLNAAGQPYRYKEGSDWIVPPYVVLSIEASTKRDDWMLIPELKQAWSALATAAKSEDQQDKVPALLQRFCLACRWSPDLVPKDSTRLQQKARAKIEPMADGRLAPGDSVGDLASLDLYE